MYKHSTLLVTSEIQIKKQQHILFAYYIKEMFKNPSISCWKNAVKLILS